MNITIVAGARPNFMKIAPIIKALEQKRNNGVNINWRLVHTGQHYDKNLSDTFFQELNIPLPDVNLNVKSGSQAEQTAAIMIGFEKDLFLNPCDLVIVVGDVTSTMACAIVAKKAGIKVAHVEAGIRSGDMSMPEEINRIVTDSITDYFFTTSSYANQNLKTIGVNENRIFFVGNVMIDTLQQNLNRLKKPLFWDEINLIKKQFLVLTLHRPSNVDEENDLKTLLYHISNQVNELPIIFPVHPRTKAVLDKMQIKFDNIYFIEPLGYLEFLFLVKHSLGVLTDSGGITEEATVLNIPCITLRDTTERPETCEMGTNILVGTNADKLTTALKLLLSRKWKNGKAPDLWDGNAANRIVDYLIDIFKL